MNLLRKIFNYIWHPYKQKYGWLAIYIPNIFTITNLFIPEEFKTLNLILQSVAMLLLITVVIRQLIGGNIIGYFRKSSKDCVWIQYTNDKQNWWKKLGSDYFRKEDRIWYVNPVEVLENHDKIKDRNTILEFLERHKRHATPGVNTEIFIRNSMQKNEKDIQIEFDVNREIFLANNRETIINEII